MKASNYFSLLSIIIIFSLLLFCTKQGASQEENLLRFKREGQKRMSLKFKPAGHLIIIPVRINESDTLQFILDTGLRTTIITELPKRDSSLLDFTDSTTIKGLGPEEDLKVWFSPANKLEINNIYCNNYEFLYVKDRRLDLSSDLGVPVHGIIGADVFNRFIVKVNYAGNQLIFYDPSQFNTEKKYRRFEILPVTMYRNKPYIELPVVSQQNDTINTKLLIDNGAGDAVWLFPASHSKIQLPEKKRYSYLGRGINGHIFGYQSRIKSIHIGKYELKDVSCAFPDSAAISNISVMDIPGRNGSIGAALLMRFNMYIDYPNKVVAFKRNFNFNKPFYYDMSGLTVKAPYGELPIFVISVIRENSPADKAGLQAGDIITDINGKSVVNFTLAEIQSLFSSDPGKRIHITVNRHGELISYKFRLKADI